MKASPEAKPKSQQQEKSAGIQKLVWHPPPLKVNIEFLHQLDALLMESCRDTVDAMVVAYKRTHERELATPGGADQLLAYYTECKEKIVPHYMLELRHGPVQSLTVERNLPETITALGDISRGEIGSLLVTTRGARVSTSIYLTNNLLGQSQVTVAGSDGSGAAHLMKMLMDLQGKWQIRVGFIRMRLFSILITGALQSIYLTTLFRLFEGYGWVPGLGMVSMIMWAAMATSFYMAFPPVVFQFGKPPDSTRRRWLAVFLILNLIFWLGIAAAILFPT